ncbi:sensor histidine kinase [Hugenholtzia roseola]|uniref:sensor histidine kinase n=1 Tax=Hugenholtzia roseola TaxID=1002 RepID=UPI00047A2BE7|nr:HAMP domain-containing sensor histidine kinase [Hugenholtzia roseola]
MSSFCWVWLLLLGLGCTFQKAAWAQQPNLSEKFVAELAEQEVRIYSKSWRVLLDSLEKGTSETRHLYLQKFENLTQKKDLNPSLKKKIAFYFFIYEARKKLLQDTAVVGLLVEAKERLHTIESAGEAATEVYGLYERGTLYALLGNILVKMLKEEEAITYYLQAAEMYQQAGCLYELAYQYDEIGTIYWRIKDWQRAAYYFEKELLIAENIKDLWLTMHAHLNFGLAKERQGAHQIALQHFHIGLEYAQKRKDSAAIGLLVGNIGAVYIKEKEYEKAKTFLEQDYLLSRRFGEVKSAINALNALVEIAIIEGDWKRAELLGDSALVLAEKYAELEVSRAIAYKNLHLLYAQQKNFEKAYHYLLMHDSLYENRLKNQNHAKIYNAEAAYNLGKKTTENELLKEKNQNKIIVIVCILIGAALLFFLAYILHKSNSEKAQLNAILLQKTKEIELQNNALIEKNAEILSQNEEVELLNEQLSILNNNLEQTIYERTQELEKTVGKLSQTQNELETFMYNAAHDLRAPILRILGLVRIGRMELQTATGENLPEPYFLSHFEETAHHLDRLIRKLIAIHEILTAEPHHEPLEAKTLMEALAHFYEKNPLKSPYIQFALHDYTYRPFLADEKLLLMALFALLENALLFRSTHHQTQVTLNLKQDKTATYFEVSSNGATIETALHEKIFEMFFRGSLEHKNGHGLGLYMVKKIAEQLGATISLQVQGQKNIFLFTLLEKEREESLR